MIALNQFSYHQWFKIFLNSHTGMKAGRELVKIIYRIMREHLDNCYFQELYVGENS